ncbi:MAG TPA: hypothetical protein VLG49_00315 [Rhabdochlamydiaceae bacterium]|nr:hypothetical protein [Rhabdochlamydiaceae bacterium]
MSIQFHSHYSFSKGFENYSEPIQKEKRWTGVYGDELDIILGDSEEVTDERDAYQDHLTGCQTNEIVIQEPENIDAEAFLQQVLSLPEEPAPSLDSTVATEPVIPVEEQHLLNLLEKNVITPIERLEIVLFFTKKMHSRMYSNLLEKGPEWIDDIDIGKYIPENLKVIMEDDKWTVKNIWEIVVLPAEYGSPRFKQILNKEKGSVWEQEPIIVFNTGLIATKLFPNILGYPSLYKAMSQIDFTKTSLLKTIEILDNLKMEWSDTVRTRELIIDLN